MLSVEEALQCVLSQVVPGASVDVAARDALGLVLAEDVESDVDSPPHDKSLVDGYAVMSADLAEGVREFEVLAEVTAGDVPHQAVTPGTTIRIMTGAPIPDGADAVVMVERSELLGGAGQPQQVRLATGPLTPGQNIMPRAASLVCGDRVLAAGHALRAIEIGLLAEVGRTHVRVIPRPTLAVLSTGNELVPADVVPDVGHIRNSNGPMLSAAAALAGAASIDLGIARDESGLLRERISQGLQCDILVLSGGVSAGVLDLVPGVLKSLGVKQIFHKVRVKPGKPLWFGTLEAEDRRRLVFGLPGNPVSSLVCFELFVRPAIARVAGRQHGELEETEATLTAPYTQHGERPTYHPARIRATERDSQVEPLRCRGSGDLAAVAAANALICFPPAGRKFEAGERVRVLKLPEAY